MSNEEILQLTVKTIEEIGGYPVFQTNIAKDELESNLSFFIYENNGQIRKAEGHNQYLRDFQLFFITKEAAEIDEFGLILSLQKCGLRFRETQYDYGRIANTDAEAKMTTFYFHRALVVSE